jgi:phosphate transport system protein
MNWLEQMDIHAGGAIKAAAIIGTPEKKRETISQANDYQVLVTSYGTARNYGSPRLWPKTVAALKIASNLERCGDLAKSIAKRALVLTDVEPMPALSRSIERMGQLVQSRLRSVLDAYASSDAEGAMEVWRRDHEVDEHYNSLFRELLTYMMGDARTITPCAHLLFVAKNLERIGDHATNIAEIVHYEISGEQVNPGDRPRSDDLRA